MDNIWRRERDSNPRYPFRHNGFQDRRYQPPPHPSAFGKGPRLISLPHLQILRASVPCAIYSLESLDQIAILRVEGNDQGKARDKESTRHRLHTEYRPIRRRLLYRFHRIGEEALKLILPTATADLIMACGVLQRSAWPSESNRVPSPGRVSRSA